VQAFGERALGASQDWIAALDRFAALAMTTDVSFT
jgi:hypothetical protein